MCMIIAMFAIEMASLGPVFVGFSKHQLDENSEFFATIAEMANLNIIIYTFSHTVHVIGELKCCFLDTEFLIQIKEKNLAKIYFHLSKLT